MKSRTIVATAIMDRKTAKGPVPSQTMIITVESALKPQTTGITNGRFTQGHVSKCAKSSNATTTNGGRRRSRSPVQTAALAEITRKAVKNGIHDRSRSERRPSGFVDDTEFATSSEIGYRRARTTETPANMQVPISSEGAYHQLVSPIISGKSPAATAGTIGDRITRTIKTAVNTMMSTDSGQIADFEQLRFPRHR